MAGGSLQKLIDQNRQEPYHVSENDVAIVAYSVLQGLKDLHSMNIIHRDIKVN